MPLIIIVSSLLHNGDRSHHGGNPLLQVSDRHRIGSPPIRLSCERSRCMEQSLWAYSIVDAYSYLRQLEARFHSLSPTQLHRIRPFINRCVFSYYDSRHDLSPFPLPGCMRTSVFPRDQPSSLSCRRKPCLFQGKSSCDPDRTDMGQRTPI